MSATANLKGKGKAVQRSPQMSSRTSSSSSCSASSSEATNSDDDSDLEEPTPEYLESLLAKAKENMARRRQETVSFNSTEEDEITLDPKDGADALPPLDPGKLPKAYFKISQSLGAPSVARDVDAENAENALGSLVEPAAPMPPEELKKDGKPFTKKEKKALKATTSGPGWFDLPAPDAADLPRLFREVEALRLRNALDPKRFYRKDEGEGKGIKGLPKQFVVGTIIPSTTPFGTASADNLTRSERKRTIVDELVDDAEAKRYAKKKFEDLQRVRGVKGRGTLAQKKALRKTKW